MNMQPTELLGEVKRTCCEGESPDHSSIADLIRRNRGSFSICTTAANVVDRAIALIKGHPDLSAEQAGGLLNIMYHSFTLQWDFVEHGSDLMYDGAEDTRSKIAAMPSLDHGHRYEVLSKIGEDQREALAEKAHVPAERELIALYTKAALAESGIEEVAEHLDF